MVLQSTDQLAEFEQLLFQEVRVIQHNKLGIQGKLLDVIRDNSGLHKLNIEQEFISRGNVGKIVRETKPTVATVYTRNILTVEKME